MYERLAFMSEKLSRLRQQLQRLAARHLAVIRSLLKTESFIRGSIGRRARVCGNPGCKCARGERHESVYLSVAVDGRTRQVHVPAGDELHVAGGVRRYRKWHSIATKLAEIDAEEKQVIDALSKELLEPYPPGNPVPPARQRGRRPKES
jgi:hypothetical protein